MHEAVENMSSALDIVERPGSEVCGGVVGASVLRKEMCAEDGGEDLVRDGVCLFSQHVSKEVGGAPAHSTSLDTCCENQE